MEKLEELISRVEKLESKVFGTTSSVENASTEQGSFVADPSQMPAGTLAYSGNYVSPDGEIRVKFGGPNQKTHILLSTSSKEITQVLEALASEDRFEIIKLLLKRALTAKEIMDILDFSTTGKVYHHLSFLEKLNIIQKSNDRFKVSSKYVPCILLIVAGINTLKGGNN